MKPSNTLSVYQVVQQRIQISQSAVLSQVFSKQVQIMKTAHIIKIFQKMFTIKQLILLPSVTEPNKVIYYI